MQKLYLVYHSLSQITGVTFSSLKPTRHFDLHIGNSKLCACALYALCVLGHVNGSTAAVVISGELKVWRLLIHDHMFACILIHQGTLHKDSTKPCTIMQVLGLWLHARMNDI